MNNNCFYLILVVFIFSIYSCEMDSSRNFKIPNGYFLGNEDGDELIIFYGNDDVKKRVDFIKVNSKYFTTFYPSTWNSINPLDSFLTLVDTLDSEGSGIVIRAIPSGICDLEDMGIQRELAFKSQGLEILKSKTIDILSDGKNVKKQELVIANSDSLIFQQICYYFCNSESVPISSCLTTSELDKGNRALIIETISAQMVGNLKG